MVPPGLSVGWLLILAAGVPLVASLETVRRLSSLEKAVVDMRSEMRRFGATAERLASPGERLLARIDTREPTGGTEARPVRRNPRRQGAETLENRLGARATTCFEGFHVCGPAHRYGPCPGTGNRSSSVAMDL